ncbi:MAG TPA: hypothetical protein VIL44_09900 [Micromonospora sp.]|jgi:hypothetical protein
MTVDSEKQRPAGEGIHPAEPVSRATVIAYSIAAVLLIGWFFFGWLVLQQGFINSVGETVGTAFALLLIAAVIGSVRRDRR